MYLLNNYTCFRTDGIRWEGQRQGTVLLINLLIIIIRTTYMMLHHEAYPSNLWQIGLVRLVTTLIILCGFIRIYIKKYYLEKME